MELEKTMLQKREQKRQNNKTKSRRMSNSNLLIPTSDDSESSLSDSLSYDSQDEKRYRGKNRRLIIEIYPINGNSRQICV